MNPRLALGALTEAATAASAFAAAANSWMTPAAEGRDLLFTLLLKSIKAAEVITGKSDVREAYEILERVQAKHRRDNQETRITKIDRIKH